MAPKGKDKGGAGKGKGKGGKAEEAEEKGAGKVKGAQQINVRHILVRGSGSGGGRRAGPD